MLVSKLATGLTAAIILKVVGAQSASAVPGFDDPQGVSISVGGTDAEGRTTLVVSPGEATSGSDVFYGTATIVEGASDASLNWVVPTKSISLGAYCTLASGKANCVGQFEGHAITTTIATSDIFLPHSGTGTASAATASAVSSASQGFTAVSMLSLAGLAGMITVFL